jgi:small neutral amino acid transporter SnatA (MarC family)
MMSDHGTGRSILAKTATKVFGIGGTLESFSGERSVEYIGDNGVKVITRLMDFILAVIGVQMLIHGVGGDVTAFSAS